MFTTRKEKELVKWKKNTGHLNKYHRETWLNDSSTRPAAIEKN